MLNGGVHFTERGIVNNIRAMRLQTMLMGITNENVNGFDKIGYQRKIPVVSSFAEFIGEDALSTTTDDSVKLNKNGELLSLEGGKVLDNMGNPIILPLVPESLDQVSVDLNGVVKVLNNKTRKLETAATLGIVTQDGVAVLAPNVRQRYSEFSNVNLQTEFMDAMMYPKTFEANRQLFQIQNSNLQRVISSLGSN